MGIAGLAVLWRQFLNDHPVLKSRLATFPHNIGRTLLCGSCFTYWLSLAYLFFFNPIPSTLFVPRTSFGNITPILIFLFSWMALSWLSLVFRFSYVMIQELVAHAVHNWKGEKHHHH